VGWRVRSRIRSFRRHRRSGGHGCRRPGRVYRSGGWRWRGFGGFGGSGWGLCTILRRRLGIVPGVVHVFESLGLGGGVCIQK